MNSHPPLQLHHVFTPSPDTHSPFTPPPPPPPPPHLFSLFQISACDAVLLPCRCHSAWQNKLPSVLWVSAATDTLPPCVCVCLLVGLH